METETTRLIDSKTMYSIRKDRPQDAKKIKQTYEKFGLTNVYVKDELYFYDSSKQNEPQPLYKQGLFGLKTVKNITFQLTESGYKISKLISEKNGVKHYLEANATIKKIHSKVDEKDLKDNNIKTQQENFDKFTEDAIKNKKEEQNLANHENKNSNVKNNIQQNDFLDNNEDVLIK